MAEVKSDVIPDVNYKSDVSASHRTNFAHINHLIKGEKIDKIYAFSFRKDGVAGHTALYAVTKDGQVYVIRSGTTREVPYSRFGELMPTGIGQYLNGNLGRIMPSALAQYLGTGAKMDMGYNMPQIHRLEEGEFPVHYSKEGINPTPRGIDEVNWKKIVQGKGIKGLTPYSSKEADGAIISLTPLVEGKKAQQAFKTIARLTHDLAQAHLGYGIVPNSPSSAYEGHSGLTNSNTFTSILLSELQHNNLISKSQVDKFMGGPMLGYFSTAGVAVGAHNNNRLLPAGWLPPIPGMLPLPMPPIPIPNLPTPNTLPEAKKILGNLKDYGYKKPASAFPPNDWVMKFKVPLEVRIMQRPSYMRSDVLWNKEKQTRLDMFHNKAFEKLENRLQDQDNCKQSQRHQKQPTAR